MVESFELKRRELMRAVIIKSMTASLITLLMMGFLVNESLPAQEPDALSVMKRNDGQRKAKDEKVRITMNLIDAGGRVRKRELILYTKYINKKLFRIIL